MRPLLRTLENPLSWVQSSTELPRTLEDWLWADYSGSDSGCGGWVVGGNVGGVGPGIGCGPGRTVVVGVGIGIDGDVVSTVFCWQGVCRQRVRWQGICRQGVHWHCC